MLITDKEELKKFYSEKRVWQGVPSIEKVNNRLFCSFFSGETAEQFGNYTVLLKSDDGGKSWGEPIAAVYKEGVFRCTDACLWTDPIGRLWLFWAYFPAVETYASICDEPCAEELSWSNEFKVSDGVMLNKPIVISSGEWLFPISVWPDWLMYAPKGKESGAFVYVSHDMGKTFKRLGCPKMQGRGYDENMVVELNDKRLMMFTRTLKGISHSYSYDFGRTWTYGEETGIQNPVTRFHLKKLKSGRLLFINNFITDSRTNLTACLSEDDGKTWKYRLLLDERDYVCYPDSVESENGEIYIIYERGRGVFKRSFEEVEKIDREILFAKITEDDIIHGKLVREGSSLKNIISKLGDYTGDKKELYRLPLYLREQLRGMLLSDKSADEIFEEIVSPLMLFYDMSCVDFESLKEKCEEYRDTKSDTLFEEVIDLLSAARSKGKYVIAREFSGSVTVEDFVEAIIKKEAENCLKNANVNIISKKTNMSPCFIGKTFKSRTGLFPDEYFLAVKISRIKALTASGKEITDGIAEELGFLSKTELERSFYEYEGITLEEYTGL